MVLGCWVLIWLLIYLQMTVGEGRDLQAVPLTKFQKLVRTAVSTVVPGSYKAKDTDQDYVEAYTEHYNCCPPPLFMIIISIVEVYCRNLPLVTVSVFTLYGSSL